MSEIAPKATVAAPVRIPLSFGAFSVLPFRENADRWFNGVQWETLACEPAGVYGAPDCDATLVEGLPRILGKLDSPLGTAKPFSVYGHHLCSPIGNTFEWAQGKAREHLESHEESAVETGIQAVIVAKGAKLTGVTDPWDVVGGLEQHFSEVYGGQGVLWMSRRLASDLGSGGALTSRGGKLFTPLGTQVVAGTGFDDGFVAISSFPAAYRSDIEDLSSRDYDLLDRGKNDLLAVAERTYLVGFEDCGLTYAQLTLPAITITPAPAA